MRDPPASNPSKPTQGTSVEPTSASIVSGTWLLNSQTAAPAGFFLGFCWRQKGAAALTKQGWTSSSANKGNRADIEQVPVGNPPKQVQTPKVGSCWASVSSVAGGGPPECDPIPLLDCTCVSRMLCEPWFPLASWFCSVRAQSSGVTLSSASVPTVWTQALLPTCRCLRSLHEGLPPEPP